MDSDPDQASSTEAPTLDAVRFEDFEALVDTSFELPDEKLELRLCEVSALGQPPKAGGRITRQAFSCLFRGPVEPVLAQGIRRLEHETLGSQELFLVPVGDAEDGGTLYEAVFT